MNPQPTRKAHICTDDDNTHSYYFEYANGTPGDLIIPIETLEVTTWKTIVDAVNNYEALKKTNEELLKAMRKAVKDIESGMNVSTFPPSSGIPLENAKVVLEIAIARVEGVKS